MKIPKPWQFVIFSILISIQNFSLLAQQTYYPETQLRNEIRTSTVESLKQKGSQPSPPLLNLVFKSNQCFKPYEDVAKKYGWPAYQAPTAIAYRKIVLAEIIEGRIFSDSEIRSVYEAEQGAHAASRPDEGLNNEGLQRKYDPMIVEALWVATMYKLSKKRRPAARALALSLREQSQSQRADSAPHDKQTINPDREPEKVTDPIPIIAPPGLEKTSGYEVEEIILRTVTSYGLSGVYLENEVSVLFQNGALMADPNLPLSELDVRESKRQHPKKWAIWRRKGNVLEVHKAWKNKTYEWKKWFTGREGHRIDGRFTTSDAYGGAAVINASTVQFNRDGQFAWQTTKGGNTSWKPVYSQQKSAGTYEIDAYSIHLTYNDGRRESYFFGLYPKDDLHFVIGSRHFTPVR